MYSTRYAEAPTDTYTRELGTVIDASDTSDSGADWALIEVPTTADYTNEILGFDAIGEIQEPQFSDRLIMSGGRTGLIGAELLAVGVGSQFGDRYEYVVDQENTTGGNSGSAIGVVKNGTFHPFGLHHAEGTNITTSITSGYAVELSTVLSQSGSSLDTSAYSKTTISYSDLFGTEYDVPAFEATIIDYDNTTGTVDVLIINIANTSGTQNVVLQTKNGYEVSSTPVTLDSNENTIVSLDRIHDTTAAVKTDDYTWTIDMEPYLDVLPIKPPINILLQNTT